MAGVVISGLSLRCPSEFKVVTGDFPDYSKYPADRCKDDGILSFSRQMWALRPHKEFKFRGEGCIVHNGLDIRAYWGHKVFAAHDGQVVVAESDWMGYLGACVVLHHPGAWGDFQRLYTVYAHMEKASLQVKIGDEVRAGRVLGKSGRKGVDHPYASHLHFELRGRTIACRLPVSEQHLYSDPETLLYIDAAPYIKELVGT